MEDDGNVGRSGWAWAVQEGNKKYCQALLQGVPCQKQGWREKADSFRMDTEPFSDKNIQQTGCNVMDRAQ